MTSYRYIIITGDPVSGLKFYGPYISHDHATNAAAKIRDVDWWITELELDP